MGGVHMTKSKAAYLYIAPMCFFFLIFTAYPVVFTIQTSFYKWNGMSANKSFIGLQNYVNIFHDGIFYIILKNFVIFGLLSIFTQMMLGLILAVMLKSKLPISGFYKTVIFMPVVLTPTIIGYIFSRILEYNLGAVNVFLRAVHLDFLALGWLSDIKVAIFTLVAVNIWQWTGYSMMMYMAGLSTIPEEMFEAAKIDGANSIKIFIHVLWPMLKSTHFTLTILGVIGVLKTFDIPYILTNGGPVNSTQFFSTYIYQKAFSLYDAGSASTLAVILLILAIICTVVQNHLYSRSANEV
jgi:raffinose/stachyose/melibiose transport system permease protein